MKSLKSNFEVPFVNKQNLRYHKIFDIIWNWKFLIPIEIETFVNLDTNESKVFYILIPIEIHGKFWYQKSKTFVIPIEI